MADDLLKYEDNGTITCSVGGTRYRLRRPKVGELRRLWEGWEEGNDDTIAHIEERAAEVAALDKILDGDDTIAKLDARKERRGIQTEIRFANQAVWAGWARDAFATLGDGKLPDDDEQLEPWLLTATTGLDFIRHWQKVPKASGLLGTVDQL